MNRQKITVLLVVLLCCLLLTGAALANGATTIDWRVVGGGGGRVETGIYTLDGTIGQAVVGPATYLSYNLCSGFWCGAPTVYRVYLPLLLQSGL